MNNGDKIRELSNEELALVVMCLIEHSDDIENVICGMNNSIENKRQYCYHCVLRWLNQISH